MRREEKELRGRVGSYISEKLESGETLHFTLVDPNKIPELDVFHERLELLVSAGTDAFLVGGSVGVSESEVDKVVKELKKYGLPVILFPGNVSGISRYADAILFMSLLNSDNPYFIIGAQVLGAPIVIKYGLEVLPTAYLIIEYGGAAGHVGRARPIPADKPEVGVAYALAAQLLGMKYVYLEAGSGAPKPVPPEFVSEVRKATSLTVIVGGGIRQPETAVKIRDAGAHIIVTGTVFEKEPAKAVKVIKAIKRGQK